MKSKILIITLLLTGIILINCTETKSPEPNPTPETTADAATPKMTHEQQVEHGKYLVEIMDCNVCHTPKMMTDRGPVPDPGRLLSGHPADEKLVAIKDASVLQNYALFNMGLTAWVGPWGTSFTANLTPDESGLGGWTIDNFERAMREGKFKGLENGRTLLPPMPWESFRHLSDNDLAAIWAYLQSIPPVKNVVPAAIPPAAK